MGGEVLLNGPTSAELAAGGDLPETHGRVGADPPVHLQVFVVARILIFVVHLPCKLVTLRKCFYPKKKTNLEQT